jgi:hypothetical protein
MSACPKCGAAAESFSTDFCPTCGTAWLPQPVQTRIPAPHLSDSAIPWDSVGTIGILRAILHTLRECLFSPFLFFSKVSPPYNAAMPFIFALILGSAGSVASFGWTWLFLSAFNWSFPLMDGFTDTLSMSASGLIFMPLLISAKIVSASVYLQTVLMLTGTKRQKFKSTFVIMCYAESAAALNIVPLAGSIVSPVWSLVLLSAGLSRVHRMSVVKAFALIFLPLLILGIIGILAVAVMAGAAAFLAGLL